MTQSKTIKRVMISSTILDLPEHRGQARDACLRMDMFPEMMEHLPATDTDAIRVSREMVDRADLYLGILAFRYGTVPKASNPQEISITEMEYDRARERGIPRLIFLMDKSHPITAADMDEDTADPADTARRKSKLAELKKRASHERVPSYFKSPMELHSQIIQSLVPYRESDLSTFHYISEIPVPPEPYIAHPYTLLQTRDLVGRQAELNLLTDWVLKRQEQIYWARLFHLVAIGGMGKSALAWKWFNDIAPQEITPLTGRMWWSFYESDATFENFVIRALAYVTRRGQKEVELIPASDREAQLFAVLNREPFLLVLDGLERILIGYARADGAQLNDIHVDNQKNLRKVIDPRAGRFLRKLTQVRESRILVSSRLYPADLETDAGDPILGSFRHNMGGLSEQDSVDLWRAFEVSGSRDELLPIFNKVNRHPLLIQALAGEVKRYHRAPGNFQEWRKDNPEFDPFQYPRVQEAMAHVLEFALRGLNEKARKVLHTIAAFRMPARYDTLAALLVERAGTTHKSKKKPKPFQQETSKICNHEHELDLLLTELEERGLLGWDKRANRYDLHPLVRGMIWNELGTEIQHGIYTTLESHFESLPALNEYYIRSIDDLTPAIELYNALIRLGKYDIAFERFQHRLSGPTLHRLSASRQRAELLEMFFPDGLDQLPRLTSQISQAVVLNELASAYQLMGQPGRAARTYLRYVSTSTGLNEPREVFVGLNNLSRAWRISGELHKSEASSRHALIMAREHRAKEWEAVALALLGATKAARGDIIDADLALQRSWMIFSVEASTQAESVVNALQAESALWMGRNDSALSHATKAWNLAHNQRFERDFITAARLQGAALLALNDIEHAEERLRHALTRARAVDYLEEELPALIALARLRIRQGDLNAARDLLNEVFEPAESGPYPLFHADAYNELARLERDSGNTSAAIEAAQRAYRLAWCDGGLFAYDWGIFTARQCLSELIAPEPQMPAFDESKYDALPEVEINPNDELHVKLGI